MIYIDTHCHIHDSEFFAPEEAEIAYTEAIASGVQAMVLVGTSVASSKQAIEFSSNHPEGAWAAVGIHPHEAANLNLAQIKQECESIADLASNDKVVAVGECGFDFYYNDRSKHLSLQRELLEQQLQIASNFSLPVSFHVREAFQDFWPVFDNFPGIKGVLHSFTDSARNLEEGLKRGLYIGVNGIATFTSHEWQRELFATLPLDSLLLETDAPFLTPHPMRGKMNTPKNVIYITEYLAELRGETIDGISYGSTDNARKLFDLS